MHEKIIQENRVGELTLRMSNDAFFFITKKEPPLDDENLQEAKRILAELPAGTQIKAWATIENSDQIEAIFITPPQENYDECLDITNHAQLQIKWLGPNLIKVWLYNSRAQTKQLWGNFKVYADKYGHRCFHTGEQDKEFTTGNMSLFFMEHFRKRIAQENSARE